MAGTPESFVKVDVVLAKEVNDAHDDSAAESAENRGSDDSSDDSSDAGMSSACSVASGKITSLRKLEGRSGALAAGLTRTSVLATKGPPFTTNVFLHD